MTGTNFQIELLEKIITRFPRKMDGVDELCRLLNSTRDPVYRRLRGDTALTPDEMLLLARHFHVSLDEIAFRGASQVVCSFNAFSNRITTFSDYLEHYLDDLKRIQELPEAHIFYTSAEIPVFSYMFFPELICFKLYVWGRTTWNLKSLQDRKFSFDMISPHELRLVQGIVEAYNNIASTELWSLGIVDNTLAQIEYHLYSNGFQDSYTALQLCDRMLDWAEHQKKIAIHGKKFMPGRGSKPSFYADTHIFHNEMVYTNNTVLIKSAKARIFYAALSNPDFISSYDEKLCEHIDNWFTTILSKSTNITGSAEKSREWFFRILEKKIETVKKRIQLFLGDIEL